MQSNGRGRIMAQFNITKAKAHFSELVKMALLGEEVVIAKDNKPLLRLVPLQSPNKVRVPSTGKGQVTFIASDFDGELDEFKGYR